MSTPLPPSEPTAGSAPRNRRGLLALILGIVAVVLAAVPFASYIAWLVGIAAMVLGVLAIIRTGSPKRAGIAGIVLGAVAVVLSVVLSIVYTVLLVLVAHGSSVQGAAAPGGDVHRVVYAVTGEGTASAIAYYTVSGGRSGQTTLQDQDLPWSKAITVRGTLTSASSVLTVIGQNAGSGTIGCSITLDGKVVVTQTGQGQGAAAQCIYRPTQ